jgi:hypothetical protein
MPELTRRYVVMTMAAAAPFDPVDPDAPFVLKPWKDPAALLALKIYRDHCYPELARDLDRWIQAVEAGPTVRGDVGRRNEEHLLAAGKVSGRGSREPGKRRPRVAPRPARGGQAKRKRASRRAQAKKRGR